MPQPELTFPVYRDRYLNALRSHGVGDPDAEAAVGLGWSILQVHQACFGTGSTVPIDYAVLPAPAPHSVMASCSGRRFDERPPGYVIYPVGLRRLSDEHYESYRGLVHRPIVDFALGVHEVRHHAQDVVLGLRLFSRGNLSGDWYDAQAVVVACSMREQFAEEEQKMRADGVPEDVIEWVHSDTEFDAEVIERLFMHRAADLTTPEAMAAFVKMDAPRL
jgi:hypothetical protein